MKKVLNFVIAIIVLTSLTACVVSPFPFYGGGDYGGGGEHSRHYGQHDGEWRR